MKVLVLKEAGYEEALLGMSLSYYDHALELEHWWSSQYPRAVKRAAKLAHMPGNSGETKFLESIQVWIFIQASRDFWQEFDTYRVGVTKQSASTMHTLTKRDATYDDFEEGTTNLAITNLNLVLADKEGYTNSEYTTRVKANLPEGWLQERVVCTSYSTLKHMINQRENHRLKYWPQFCKEIAAQVRHPEFLEKQNDTES